MHFGMMGEVPVLVYTCPEMWNTGAGYVSISTEVRTGWGGKRDPFGEGSPEYQGLCQVTLGNMLPLPTPSSCL